MSIDYLKPLKLEKYATKFDEEGYEDPDLLMDMGIDELVQEFDMKKGHAKQLRKWLDKRSTAASEPDRPSLAPSLPARSTRCNTDRKIFVESRSPLDSMEIRKIVCEREDRSFMRVWPTCLRCSPSVCVESSKSHVCSMREGLVVWGTALALRK